VPGLTIPPTFAPELIDAFEIGSKNTFANGKLMLNATAFYYKYNGLQLSRIVARTSINDNINADIYGVEIESVVRPDPTVTINMGFSYLHTKVTSDTPFINQRDPSGGNPNTVIIKDPQAFNCVVLGPSAGAAQAFVTAANDYLNSTVGLTRATGLRPPESFGPNSGLGAATGAYSSCAGLRALAESPLFDPAGVISVPDGIEVSIKGNSLPQAPVLKFNVGAQKRIEFPGGWALTPRADLVYTGESYGNIFNGNINRIPGYEVVNAQIQLDSPDERFYARAFVQNMFDVAPVTGLYLTDASSGFYTNIFTLEPRRYGIAAGFKF
jgi:outer membrane receptor protein involved in Fe transport